MRAGSLKHIVSVEYNADVQDSAGQPIKDWQLFASRWAAIVPLRGRELFTAREIFAEASVQITMRYFPGLDATMRIRHGETVYNILSVVDVETRHLQYDCLCQSGLTDG